MAYASQGDDEIVDLTKQCVALFTDVKKLLSDRPGNQFILALDYEQRFQYWVESFRLSSELRRSIKTEQGRQQGLRNAVFQLLELLEVNLGRSKLFFDSA